MYRQSVTSRRRLSVNCSLTLRVSALTLVALSREVTLWLGGDVPASIIVMLIASLPFIRLIAARKR